MEFYLLNITSWLESHQIPCIFKSFTHMDCPGCGVQRSFVLLLQGDVPGSFIMYPALMPILLLFAFMILHVILKIRERGQYFKIYVHFLYRYYLSKLYLQTISYQNNLTCQIQTGTI
ncbi:MAG: DUF2752 domain-containing protein [Chitinophagaceae bacterium]|nr:DUF2752 domain-containing protein [Chitinophagaceae bacterium]